MPKTGQDLAGHIKSRRVDLGLGPSDAARLAGVSRPTWSGWEKGVMPYDKNWIVVERVLQWERGSIEAILDGRGPTPLSKDPERSGGVPPIPAGVKVDPKIWARWDPIDRENIINAVKLAEQRQRAADAAAQTGPERQRPRGA